MRQSRTGVHIGVVGLVVVLILLAEIHTARQFADADENPHRPPVPHRSGDLPRGT